MPRLLISAAHTLENPGEIFGGLREADLTRNILKKTLPYLEKHNIEFQAVPLDLQLLKRIDWIRSTGYSKEQGDIFVEIHVNDGGKRGIEGWFDGNATPDNNSQKLADTVVKGICQKTGYPNQGVKSEYEHELGSLIILNQSNVYATAIECLYIDNQEDIEILKSETKLDQLAKAIADSINDYIKTVAPTVTFKKANESSSQSGVLASNQGSAFQNPTTSTLTPLNTNPVSAGKPLLMDREERKEMIKKIFLKILGKEPNQNDLNYHLNTGVAEQDLIKKLIDGEEHAKLIKDALEHKELSDKVSKLSSELEQWKTNIEDTKAMQETMNRLLEHKNMLIIRLNQELENHNVIVRGGHIDSIISQSKHLPAPQQQQNARRKRTFMDFLMDIFKL